MKIQQIFPYVAIIVLFFSCNAGSNQRTNTEETKAVVNSALPPEIEFSNIEIDLGELVAGEIISYTFNFTNKGGKPLIIQRIEASCGCTTTNYTQQPVKTGHSGTVDVIFDSTGFRGLQIKTITVYSNATTSPTKLTLAALIKKN